MGTGGSKALSRQTAQRSSRRRRRGPRSEETVADSAASKLLHSAHSGEGDLREAIARSNGDSTAGIVIGLQRAYGNRAVAGLLQRQPKEGAPEGGGGSSAGIEQVGGGTSASPTEQPMLRVGSSGAAVNQLQAILNTFGATPPLAVDGQFGGGTRSGVVSFQREHGLQADGIVGPKTWGALYGTQPTFGKDTSQQPVPEGAAVGYETPDEEWFALATRAKALVDAERFAEALPLLRRIYSLPELNASKRTNALRYIAICYHRLGQKEQAISAWEEFLAMPENTAGDHLYALEHLRELRTGEAWKSASEIAKPPSPSEQAAADAQALVELNAGHDAGHSGDDQGALTHFQNAYALGSASLPLRLAATSYAGLAHRRLGEFDRALDVFQEALGFPDSAYNQPVGDLDPVSRQSVLISMRNSRAGHTESVPSQPPIPEEEMKAQLDQAHELFHQGQYAASLAILEKLYQSTDDLAQRRQVTLLLGQCHQRLGQFDKAVSLFMEYLGYPDLGPENTAQIEELLRQARMREVGTHVTVAEPGKGAAPDGLPELFRGEVYFETDKTVLNSLGESTINTFGNLLNERMAAEKGISISVEIIGHASSRWRSVSDDSTRHALNESLARDRAETVHEKLLPLAPEPPFAYKTDSMGDTLGDKVTSNRDDNTWFFRSVTIVALGASPSAPPTVQVGPS